MNRAGNHRKLEGVTVAKPKKPAHIDKRIGRHRLYAERGVTGWYFVCESWPDLAEKYDGCLDASAALTEFELRATAGGKQQRKAG